MHLSSLSYHSTAGGDARYLSPRHDSAASAVSSSTPSVETGRWQQSSAATTSNNNTQSNIDDIKRVHGAAAAASLDPNNAMPEASEGPSAHNRTFRVRQRRLSHPSSSPNRVRVEQEDGEFIKKAFDNLSLTQPVLPPAGSSSSSLHRGETTSTTSTLPAESELDKIILSTHPTSGSRASVASTSSHPFSALSSYSGIPYDRASIQSSYPLLSAESSRIPSGTSPPAGRRSHLRSRSSGNNHPSHRTSALLGAEDTAHSAHEERPQDATRPFHPSAETRAPSGPPASSSFRPCDASYYTSSGWSDPFAESYELPRLRMRRRSTISGYSVNTSDWNSLRRGSLASLENHSPTSATYNSNAAYPRSRNSTHSSSVHTTNSNFNNNFNNNSNNNGNSGPAHVGGGGGGYPTAASAYASMTRLQQPPTTSLRWEAWATAYRESLLQHVHSGYVSCIEIL